MSTLRCVSVFLMLICGCLPARSYGQYQSFVNKFENPALSLKKRLIVSLKQGMRSEYQNRVWIAYSIKVQDRAVSPLHQAGDSRLPTLKELITAPQDISSDLRKSRISELLSSEFRDERLKLQREAADEVAILLDFSIESGRPILLRLVTVPINDRFRLGYQELYWLGSVQQRESVGLLSDCFNEYSFMNLRKSILTVLGIHAASSGKLAVFKNILNNNAQYDFKEMCLFLLGRTRAIESELIISKFLMSTKDKELKRNAILALSYAKGKAAYNVLKYVIENDRDQSIRKHAMLSFGMMSNDKALPILTNILLNEKNEEMREFAVFVMGQITHPKAETLLTQIGRTYPDHAIRQKALRWVQRNQDHRAHHVHLNMLNDSD